MSVSDEKRAKLQVYVPLTKFLAHFLGKDCEIVLHDITNVEESIIAIENGHVSGRKIGDPLKNLGRFFKDGAPVKADYIKKHIVTNKSNYKIKSASYFIRDENQDLMGMLCINMDISRYEEIRGLLDEYLIGPEFNLDTSSVEKDDNLSTQDNSIEDLTYSIIEETIHGVEIPPSRMTPDEKIEIVEKLSDRGVFLLRGSILEVAQLLETSENTIYRYISRLSDPKNKLTGR